MAIFHPTVKKQERNKEPRKNILDPQGSFLKKWNNIFILSCLLAVSLDPLFFYVAGIDHKEKCITLDESLEIIVCLLRTFIDIFYVLRIIFQFQTGFIAPSSRVLGELVDDPFAIAKRYLLTYFIVDILSVLPLPQLIVLAFMKRSISTMEMLKIVILCQYVPRFVRIVPLFREVTSNCGVLTATASAGVVINIFLYIFASHLLGALWYLFSFERLYRCWRIVFMIQNWDPRYMYCTQKSGDNHDHVKALLNVSCSSIGSDKDVFEFGMYTDAIKSGVVESTHFHSKILYCFWWGLRNFSSLGQSLKTSIFIGEIFFAVFGLIFFSLLIGNIQKYLQSTTVRVEKMRMKRQEVEIWMSHRMIQEPLRERIRKYEQYKWQETRGVEEDTLLQTLPKDLRRDIKRHLCLELLRRVSAFPYYFIIFSDLVFATLSTNLVFNFEKVPMFEKMDQHLLDTLCDRLKSALYTNKSLIVQVGDPVDEMLFILRGSLATMTKNGFFNTADLKAGDFCGEELLTWALDPNSASKHPTSTRTVEAKTEVEAFVLMADDLKLVASQFSRLHSSTLLNGEYGRLVTYKRCGGDIGRESLTSV
uniref:Cyclic nucleotide-binding domain-containing protein n=1 Tax=Cannabis sativa TaxID=3483 RepID=A0A803NV18_CANSA